MSRVYTALVEPQALVDWLPLQGMCGKLDHFDARPGGSYRMTLTYAEPPDAGGKSSDDSDVVGVDIRADDVPPGISADDHVDGLRSSLSNLADYLTGCQADHD